MKHFGLLAAAAFLAGFISPACAAETGALEIASQGYLFAGGKYIDTREGES